MTGDDETPWIERTVFEMEKRIIWDIAERNPALLTARQRTVLPYLPSRLSVREAVAAAARAVQNNSATPVTVGDTTVWTDGLYIRLDPYLGFDAYDVKSARAVAAALIAHADAITGEKT